MASSSSPPLPASDLHGENALLRQVLGEAPAAMAATAGPEHRLTYFNPRYLSNSGARAQLGRPVAACLPELAAQGYIGLMDEVYRTGQPFHHHEMRVELLDPVTHQAETFYFNSTSKPLRDARGRVEGLLIFAVDTTAQVKARLAAEQALSEQREFYETLLREAPAGIVAFDAEHRYLWANPIVSLHAGFGPWMVGKTSAEACAARGYPPEVVAERERRFAQAMREHREVTWDEIIMGAEGERHWLRRMRPVFGPDGKFQLMVATGLDITEHRRAEARVREQQALMQHLLDSVPNPIRLTAADGRVHFRNAAQVDVARRTEERRRQFQTNGQVPELQRTAAAMRQVLVTHQETTLDVTFPMDNGEVRDYQVVVRPLRQPDGSAQLLTVGTDVTQLKTAQRAATAAAQAQENFLATISHEIRTPLNGVLGMAGLLAKTPLNPEQQRYLDVVQHSGRHLLAVLNDVLDMAKIRAGQLHLETVPVDLDHALRQVAETLAWQAREKSLVLTVEVFDEPPPLVLTDPYRLSQVLLNLLSNAIKFTDTGGVGLHAAVRTDTPTALTVHLEVRDTGPGLSPEAQERIFDAFAQASDDTTRRYGGTGLGLSISSSLVEQLGGHLVMCSQADRGSTFGFTVVFAKAPAPATAVPDHPGGADGGTVRGWRVLLVDDNRMNLELARTVLEQNDLLVDATDNGPAALVLFEKHRYDAVLMDVHMPGMSGLEATARIRQHPDPHRAATPVLALTADAFRAQHESYRAAGMTDVIPKPFTEAELLGKLAASRR